MEDFNLEEFAKQRAEKERIRKGLPEKVKPKYCGKTVVTYAALQGMVRIQHDCREPYGHEGDCK